MDVAGGSKKINLSPDINDINQLKCSIPSYQSVTNSNICICNERDTFEIGVAKERCILEFTITVIAYFMYFVCWLVNLWLIISHMCFDIIKYLFSAPRFIRLSALLLLILLILTTTMHVIVLSNRSRASVQQIPDNKHVLHKYNQFEKLSQKDQAEYKKSLKPEESKLLEILDKMPSKFRHTIHEKLANLDVSSIEKITNLLYARPEDHIHILNRMTAKEKEIYYLLYNNIKTSQPIRFKILLKQKYPFNTNDTQETIRKEFQLIISDSRNNKIFQETSWIDVKKIDNKFPSLEMYLDKVIIENYN